MKNIIMIFAFLCIFCLHMPSNGQQQIYEILTDPVLQVAWSWDGEYLAVVSYQGGLKIYNQGLEFLAGIYLENSPLTVSWSPDNRYLVITKFRKAEVIKWDKTSNILTSERVLDDFEDVLDALWGPTGEYIALVREIDVSILIDERNGQPIYLLKYQISFWNTNTWQTIINDTEYYETRLLERPITQYTYLAYAHPVIWNLDGSEILLTATIWSYESDEYPIDYVNFVAINPSDANRIRNFDLIRGTEARVIIWKSGYEDVVSSLQAIGVFDMNIFTGDYSNGFSSIYLDSVVADWSRDGRYLFLDGVLIYELENIGNFSNSDSETVFTADWHPYRPIIAIGSLTGRLTVEDATQFDGFTASPVADAGENRIVYVGGDLTADVVLDASASVDYDGTIIGYEWREGENVLSTNRIADVTLPIGVHDIQLTVTDDDNLTDSITIRIEVICKTISTTASLSDAIYELQNQTEYDTICLVADGQYSLTVILSSCIA